MKSLQELIRNFKISFPLKAGLEKNDIFYLF